MILIYVNVQMIQVPGKVVYVYGTSLCYCVRC